MIETYKKKGIKKFIVSSFAILGHNHNISKQWKLVRITHKPTHFYLGRNSRKIETYRPSVYYKLFNSWK